MFNLKKNPTLLIILIAVLLFAVIVGSYNSFFGHREGLSIDSATYNKLQNLEKEYKLLRKERIVLNRTIEEQSISIQALGEQLSVSKENYKKFDFYLKKIEKKYEALNRFDNYAPDSIALYFPKRYGQ